ncbi:winged helix-turn-helix domain-containing protein [Candidatus Pacearchaeota archaeon]|jgi:predicted transcriptional regulator|nr:winged helix-turn-helix domain-containing protein [Candidatus Pacearchaeota archaeon]
MKKRSRGQILLAILDLLAAQDRLKTEIVYQANLNFRTIDRYLEKLVEAGNVSWNERTRMWYLTESGREAACHLREIEAIL